MRAAVSDLPKHPLWTRCFVADPTVGLPALDLGIDPVGTFSISPGVQLFLLALRMVTGPRGRCLAQPPLVLVLA